MAKVQAHGLFWNAQQLAQHSANGDNLKLEHNYDYRNCQDHDDDEEEDDKGYEEEVDGDDDFEDTGVGGLCDGQGGVMELLMGRCFSVVHVRRYFNEYDMSIVFRTTYV